MCSCGAEFARRDLLTRHERITSHSSDQAPSPPGVRPEASCVADHNASAVEPDFAAAVSLSSLSGLTVPQSVEQWLQQIHNLPPGTLPLNSGYIEVDGPQSGSMAAVYPAVFSGAQTLTDGEAYRDIKVDRCKLAEHAMEQIVASTVSTTFESLPISSRVLGYPQNGVLISTDQIAQRISRLIATNPELPVPRPIQICRKVPVWGLLSAAGCRRPPQQTATRSLHTRKSLVCNALLCS